MLRLGGRTFGPGEYAVMAIVNRTPDSFYDRGATFARDAALRAVERAVAEGADIIDVGGSRPARVTRSTRPRRSAGPFPPSWPSGRNSQTV